MTLTTWIIILWVIILARFLANSFNSKSK